MPYITTPGQIFKYVYLTDTNQFNKDRQTPAFIYWDGNTCLLMDVGTSDDVETLFKNLNQLGIPEIKVMSSNRI